MRNVSEKTTEKKKKLYIQQVFFPENCLFLDVVEKYGEDRQTR
jgi:hypothetical protein